MTNHIQNANETESQVISFAEAFELINPHLYTVEERIRAQAKSFDPAVEGYVSYVCGAGGKRLRPALALLSAGATGKITASHVDLAVILELIHIATLVHDDIMDGAELRRDQASANAKWGNAITVLLGDCLFAHALRLSTNFSNSDICRRIADAASEVCSGEIIQTQRRHDLKLSTADYYRIIEMKTAALFTAACELGAFISEASPTVIGSLKTYGTKLGVAYQIYDDILDLAGNEDESGKTLGTDLQKGKFTLPVLLMLQSGKDVGELREILLNEDSERAEALTQMLREAGTIDAAKKIAERLIGECLEQLNGIQDNRYARGLRSIPEHLRHLLSKL
ncbi:MAG: polyprenyl synthetase family protein [bacterium]|jgi:octaprenyl-diphosphate synthase|nr:polyprenyl synthetase family protein [Verrucomicrobiota bacterium]NBR47855.1 polyprenyl synthetase family protein [bacterium]NBS51038.1 polyprenyl synthetase family protein [Spartobacteria bacterium]